MSTLNSLWFGTFQTQATCRGPSDPGDLQLPPKPSIWQEGALTSSWGSGCFHQQVKPGLPPLCPTEDFRKAATLPGGPGPQALQNCQNFGTFMRKFNLSRQDRPCPSAPLERDENSPPWDLDPSYTAPRILTLVDTGFEAALHQAVWILGG